MSMFWDTVRGLQSGAQMGSAKSCHNLQKTTQLRLCLKHFIWTILQTHSSIICVLLLLPRVSPCSLYHCLLHFSFS